MAALIGVVEERVRAALPNGHVEEIKHEFGALSSAERLYHGDGRVRKYIPSRTCRDEFSTIRQHATAEASSTPNDSSERRGLSCSSPRGTKNALLTASLSLIRCNRCLKPSWRRAKPHQCPKAESHKDLAATAWFAACRGTRSNFGARQREDKTSSTAPVSLTRAEKESVRTSTWGRNTSAKRSEVSLSRTTAASSRRAPKRADGSARLLRNCIIEVARSRWSLRSATSNILNPSSLKASTLRDNVVSA